MGALPDASRVGGTWFPDVDPEEWALPDGLASQVITPALRGGAKHPSPVITEANCTNCGRCIDVCAPNVFEFDLRWRTTRKSDTDQGVDAAIPLK